MRPLTRRDLMFAVLTTAFVARHPANAQLRMAEDGLYQQPWFVQSFLDLREDFQNARGAGKTLIVLWELKGCPLCKLLHTQNFANPEIEAYLKMHFDIVQLNFIGARPVTDFDGQVIGEKELAAKHRIEGTPTLQFYGGDAKNLPQEVHRSTYLKQAEFLDMLQSVRTKVQ